MHSAWKSICYSCTGIQGAHQDGCFIKHVRFFRLKLDLAGISFLGPLSPLADLPLMGSFVISGNSSVDLESCFVFTATLISHFSGDRTARWWMLSTTLGFLIGGNRRPSIGTSALKGCTALGIWYAAMVILLIQPCSLKRQDRALETFPFRFQQDQITSYGLRLFTPLHRRVIDFCALWVDTMVLSTGRINGSCVKRRTLSFSRLTWAAMMCTHWI